MDEVVDAVEAAFFRYRNGEDLSPAKFNAVVEEPSSGFGAIPAAIDDSAGIKSVGD
ncbi:hypothetical protein SAMN04487948_12633 [Halogranum amylolyticum]|uniref:Uncharacterized protein n=1 Tax=Halogranum amylolyticum TaxID=660520 RepID=A0A1H8WB43_9EURY|nr:hypothetical protein [Halogranum amylolyticum]SEP24850.1 hypothetical protein SAMN04487948_12633 [Halogranum amylolyticum]